MLLAVLFLCWHIFCSKHFSYLGKVLVTLILSCFSWYLTACTFQLPLSTGYAWVQVLLLCELPALLFLAYFGVLAVPLPGVLYAAPTAKRASVRVMGIPGAPEASGHRCHVTLLGEREEMSHECHCCSHSLWSLALVHLSKSEVMGISASARGIHVLDAALTARRDCVEAPPQGEGKRAGSQIFNDPRDSSHGPAVIPGAPGEMGCLDCWSLCSWALPQFLVPLFTGTATDL